MTESMKEPKLRFTGFTDAWEQRTFGEVASITMGQSPDGKNYTDNPEDYILVQGNADMEDHRVCPRVWTTQATKTAKPGDIILSVRAPVGEVGKTDYAVVLGRGVSGIRANDFIYQNLIRMNQTGFWKKLSSGSTFDSINSIDIYDALLKVPNDHEQLKVSSFFTEIDQSIDLHQRELDALKKLKKSTLQKMFPTQGKNRPLIRFAGFTDAWEQRKLSSICSMHARIGWQNLRTSEFLDSGDYYLITGTDFSDGKILLDSCHYVAKERYDQDRNIQVKNKSILITKDGTLGKVAYVEGLDKPATLNAGVFNVVISNNDVDEKYLFQYLKSPFLMDYVAQKATGGTIKHLNQTILVDFPVAMPKLAEQRKIGEFFMKLDGHVALHQRELEMLKNMKKALLQKMFC